ncbi:MAG: C1 family peptidase, partial [Candidatus Bathyarchaeota archaeon]|nr:C1 family peptidase [Candidatus Bathyarchaeota archaeon]
DSIESSSILDGYPTSIDHSQSIYFPPIGDQGSEGSCVAWAVGYYTKTFQEALDHGWDLSGATWSEDQPTLAYQDKIMSPDFIYHQINDGVDNGSRYGDAIEIITSIGACSWASMPYSDEDWTSWPDEAAWREAPLYRGYDNSSYYYYFRDDDVSALKELLIGNNLGIISINAHYYDNLTDNTMTLDNYYMLDEYGNKVPPTTNHANTVVGYDDTYTYMEGGVLKTGAFKVVNSWGTHYSTYWISYACMSERVGKFFFYYDIEDYEPQTLAVFEIDHPYREECIISFEYNGIQKYFGPQYWYDGGAVPFPSNKIVLDITELGEITDDVVMHVTDRYENIFPYSYSSATGTIVSFSVEEVCTPYDPSNPPQYVWDSTDTPLETQNNVTVSATATYVAPMNQPPLLGTPYDEDSIGSVGPLFGWEPVSNATTYVLEVATVPDTNEDGCFIAENVIYTYQTNTNLQFHIPEMVMTQGTYYWHVRAFDISGNPSPWSEVRSITLGDGVTFVMAPGWNMISFPLMPDDLSIQTIFADMADYIDGFYRWNAETEAFEVYIIEWDIGDFTMIDEASGYLIHTTLEEPYLLTVTGLEMPTSYDLNAGWNLVSWCSDEPMNIATALGETASIIDSIYLYDPFSQRYGLHYVPWGVGDFSSFVPGLGYWIYATEDGT